MSLGRCGLIMALALFTSLARAAPGSPPDLLGVDTDGRPVHLAEQHGKLVILSFWASWCGSCLRELPALEQIQQDVGRERLAVFAINYGENQQRWERIRTVFHDAQIRLLRDPGDRASTAFDVEEIPEMVIIDADGRVVSRHSGYDDETLDHLIDELNRLLSKPQPAVATDPGPKHEGPGVVDSGLKGLATAR